ncbi:hypothetical protein BACCAP_02857 [Pseudoflavonifractor capillosus ATCC 29799]|uniref:Uncharacterized protein n=1 Tax=Pseudoflavonifractor capillosus ATCC 29799 TaxID=411467 RepID=A6NXB1_9FIRM|nr:hypothetical protein BACCAP_02857 [Pseudoflavonifractor capillosus ATCC 29799]
MTAKIWRERGKYKNLMGQSYVRISNPTKHKEMHNYDQFQEL